MELQTNKQNHRLRFCLSLWCQNWQTDEICTNELIGKISLDCSIKSLMCSNQLLLDSRSGQTESFNLLQPSWLLAKHDQAVQLEWVGQDLWCLRESEILIQSSGKNSRGWRADISSCALLPCLFFPGILFLFLDESPFP